MDDEWTHIDVSHAVPHGLARMSQSARPALVLTLGSVLVSPSAACAPAAPLLLGSMGRFLACCWIIWISRASCAPWNWSSTCHPPRMNKKGALWYEQSGHTNKKAAPRMNKNTGSWRAAGSSGSAAPPALPGTDPPPAMPHK
jgi:hypothetical protein